jgi:hypothetical protein
MSYRRTGKKANLWRMRLERHKDLLRRAGIPDFVLKDENTWWRFLLHGYHQEDSQTPPVLVLNLLSERQLRVLHDLLGRTYTETERVGMDLWTELEARFGD